MELGSGSNKRKVQNKKRKSRRNKLEFLGWGSKLLIEFLDSIGKESRQYSQGVDAIVKTTIVKTYVACNNLIDPTYKRTILCDERLEKLFKKKIVSKKSVSHLLEAYFLEVAIGYVMGLLKQNPETFEDNVMGSIVRINYNPKKRSYQLHQVIGVSQSSGELNLHLSNMEAEVPISELSDRYFTEEELEEFRKQMKAGKHKRPTVEEFESKAQSLHNFLTKNWIDRELVSLKQRIDLANEKGRRA
nr:putative SWIB/MDM2 domain, Plus-3 domain protein [Ipomoea batatas]